VPLVSTSMDQLLSGSGAAADNAAGASTSALAELSASFLASVTLYRQPDHATAYSADVLAIL